MATYGRKKRSIIPSFNTFREPELSPKAPRHKAKKHVPYFQENSSDEALRKSQHEDSIEQMASILLDDGSNDNIKEDPSRHAAQIPGSLVHSNLTHLSSSKPLPRVPTLIFNGDDAWAMKSSTVVTSAGPSNMVDLSTFSDELGDDSPQPEAPEKYCEEAAVPRIPRKSSKRRSARPKSTFLPRRDSTQPLKQSLKKNISAPILDERITPKLSSLGPTDVNTKVQAMMAATEALKGNDGALYKAPPVSRKRGIMDTRAMLRIKNVLNDRIRVGAIKKRDVSRDDKLLDSHASEDPNYCEDEAPLPASSFSSLEIRMNEGDNFKNPKIFNLTGHGNIRRKPLADDGRSLRSCRSIDDSGSPQRGSSSGRAPTPRSFGYGQEAVPELPPLIFNPSTQNTPSREQAESRRMDSQCPGDFDTILTSSPLAQSTPRPGLEALPEEDGTRSLSKLNTCSQSPSYLDCCSTSTDTDGEEHKDLISATIEPNKRKDFQGREMGIRSQKPKKMKKYPFLAKDDLDKLQEAMAGFPLGSDELASNTRTDSSRDVSNLALRDINAKYRDRVQLPELSKSIESMPNLSRKPSHVKSAIDFQGNLDKIGFNDEAGRLFLSNADLEDHSMMEIDELQWDKTLYNYNMGTRET